MYGSSRSRPTFRQLASHPCVSLFGNNASFFAAHKPNYIWCAIYTLSGSSVHLLQGTGQGHRLSKSLRLYFDPASIAFSAGVTTQLKPMASSSTEADVSTSLTQYQLMQDPFFCDRYTNYSTFAGSSSDKSSVKKLGPAWPGVFAAGIYFYHDPPSLLQISSPTQDCPA